MSRVQKNDPYATRATLLLRLHPDLPEREVAWQEFYDVYSPIIGGFARNMGVPPHDITDMVHDVLVGFFGVARKFQYNPQRGRFRGYLKTCTWRVLQTRLGRQLRIADRPIEEVADDQPTVAQVWDDLWEGEALRRATDIVREGHLARPETARTFEAFERLAMWGESPEAIARELNMSVDSVYQAKSRVSKKIKAAMDALDATLG